MKALWFVSLCAVAYGCEKERSERAPASESAAALAAPNGGGEAGDAGAGDAASAWTPFARSDDVPLCMFARYEDWGDAQFLSNAKQKVALKAGRRLYLGAYVPGCADPECVRRVTLQCWTDVQGKSITVHTRFSGQQQLDHPCANDCKPSSAACETPPLVSGVYTLTHGGQQRTIRIPGVQEPACF